MSGNLLRYREPDPGNPADVRGATTIGHGGWAACKLVFTGGCGSIYAITM